MCDCLPLLPFPKDRSIFSMLPFEPCFSQLLSYVVLLSWFLKVFPFKGDGKIP